MFVKNGALNRNAGTRKGLEQIGYHGLIRICHYLRRSPNPKYYFLVILSGGNFLAINGKQFSR